MSKPDDVPKDVWDRAADIDAAIQAYYHGYSSTHELIARAIMAETERCVKAVQTLIETVENEIAQSDENTHRMALSSQRHVLKMAISSISRKQ